jgi:hypothetical protein
MNKPAHVLAVLHLPFCVISSGFPSLHILCGYSLCLLPSSYAAEVETLLQEEVFTAAENG